MNPAELEVYVAMLKAHDWYYDFTDDHRVWTKWNEHYKRMVAMANVLDPDRSIWNQYALQVV